MGEELALRSHGKPGPWYGIHITGGWSSCSCVSSVACLGYHLHQLDLERNRCIPVIGVWLHSSTMPCLPSSSSLSNGVHAIPCSASCPSPPSERAQKSASAKGDREIALCSVRRFELFFTRSLLHSTALDHPRIINSTS